ncbi:GntR family transcriptional regulator [Saccharopolyspora phatthalungensis]|uniref:GntR family transcriptional regulator n=1 Tax=Saccharopolyspora phatthalungensis TaxID=664693 RepID=UPI00161DE6A0|nr:GntR family transcriptional regulator [Saccharopolyspora phatthalungensis]
MARNIRNSIESGALRDGQRLPSTRDLAREWGVSTPVINDAMSILSEEGLVETIPRVGRAVRAPEQASTPPRPVAPRVMFIGGYAGCGKSELGRIIARETGWALLDKDSLTRPVVESALELVGRSPHDRESDFYLTSIRPREYESLINTLVENLQCGNSSIVTAPFVREFVDMAWVSRIQATCKDFGASATFVWVYCDADTMHTYVRHRGAARDAAKLANWTEYLAGIDLEFRPPVPHVVVNNSASSEPLQKQAQELIKLVEENDGSGK